MLKRTRLASYATLPDGYSFAETVAAAARAGFDEFAFWLMSIEQGRNELGSLEAVAACLARHGTRASVLELVHAWAQGDEAVAREEVEVMQAAADIFQPDAIVAATLAPELAPNALALLKDQCRALAPCKLALEFLPFTAVATLEHACRIVAEIDEPNLGFTLDTWHFARAGMDYERLAQLPGERIHYIQVNDAALQPLADLVEETLTARLRPGEGVVDWPRMIGLLEDKQVDCPLGSEQFSDVVKAMDLDHACTYLFDSVQRIVADPHYRPE